MIATHMIACIFKLFIASARDQSPQRDQLPPAYDADSRVRQMHQLYDCALDMATAKDIRSIKQR